MVASEAVSRASRALLLSSRKHEGSRSQGSEDSAVGTAPQELLIR